MAKDIGICERFEACLFIHLVLIYYQKQIAKTFVNFCMVAHSIAQ